MNDKPNLKPLPTFQSDAKAERFVEVADLASFEFEKKDAQVNFRLPVPLLNAVKARARQLGIPFTRYIRMLIERDIAR